MPIEPFSTAYIFVGICLIIALILFIGYAWTIRPKRDEVQSSYQHFTFIILLVFILLLLHALDQVMLAINTILSITPQ